ncbi:hypothetical protein CCR85_11965 [Rhodothalassium salexigens]|uniref:hypothetical protein n=1 Tax=Rhodothalassium salexigens TaxID=1086 RepID=UPI001914CB80|nr:hypothetical protein [Rhodothalassium salexigens]MBK5912205.1 hypothetical protein [Rhodothalassium salexigens]MBK5919926.1 hypothetical protein [Rhodothalassium salexigens]
MRQIIATLLLVAALALAGAPAGAQQAEPVAGETAEAPPSEQPEPAGPPTSAEPAEAPAAAGPATVAPGTVLLGRWRVTGTPVDDLPLAQIRRTRVLDDRHILFETVGRDRYLNRLDDLCPGLGVYRSFAYDTRQTRLTDLDIIDVLQPIGGGLQRVASCRLGVFHPVDRLDDPPDQGG